VKKDMLILLGIFAMVAAISLFVYYFLQ